MDYFSVRHGLRPKLALQERLHDDGSLNRVWNVLSRHIKLLQYEPDFLEYEVWDRYLKRSLDEYPGRFEDFLFEIKSVFNDSYWYEVYDMLEMLARHHPGARARAGHPLNRLLEAFILEINKVLDEENCAYRLIENSVAPIVARHEIDEVESALDSPDPVATHIQRALELLSDRAQRDYRNSIKESISAVESISNLIAEERGESLGDVLPQLEKKLGLQLHGALRKALGVLYGWTSNEGGIRHALLEESDLTQEDARYMLIVCSAFVNYLKTKAANAGISLNLAP